MQPGYPTAPSGVIILTFILIKNQLPGVRVKSISNNDQLKSFGVAIGKCRFRSIRILIESSDCGAKSNLRLTCLMKQNIDQAGSGDTPIGTVFFINEIERIALNQISIPLMNS